MIFEQQSENGGVKLIKEGQDIKGMFAYASEENVVEIREPLYLDEYEAQFQKAVRDLRSGRDVPVKIYACRNGEHVKKVPIIMVRILHLETFLSAVKVKEGERLSCSFAVLDSIITKNQGLEADRGTGQPGCTGE